jgi:azurin
MLRVLLILSALAVAAETKPVVLTVETDGEFLAFKPEELTVPAGAPVRLVFRHTGRRIQQNHNWVLVKPGTADAFDDAALAAGASHGWMPPGDPRLIAATAAASPGRQVVVDFIAPAPGDYPFLCTQEGHGFEMRGVLHVVAP